MPSASMSAGKITMTIESTYHRWAVQLQRNGRVCGAHLLNNGCWFGTGAPSAAPWGPAGSRVRETDRSTAAWIILSRMPSDDSTKLVGINQLVLKDIS